MSDLISRQEAIDAIRGFYEEYIVYDNGKSLEEVIKDLPSAQPEPQWISCSERLPEGGHNILLCRKDGTVGEGCYHSIMGEWSQFRWNATGIKDVVAWMPLPEPFKGEKDV